ncbi:MAG: hypothetical protein ACTSXD_08300 [Candidatus Heimdallarchaeaceae archaeon]
MNFLKMDVKKKEDPYIEKEIYIIVKTYPILSKKYETLICTAGLIKEQNRYKWIRIYPVSLDYYKKHYGELKKFTCIKAKIAPAKEKLSRKDSFKIKMESIEIIDQTLTDTKNDPSWEKRNKLVLPTKSKSIEDIDNLRKNKVKTIAIIKPKSVDDFLIEPKERGSKWEKELINGKQTTLVGDYEAEVRPVEHIPFIFRYVFKCNDNRCKGHKMMIEDWEILELWRKEKKSKGIEKAHKSVKYKCIKEMTERNLHFIIGTESSYNNWIIIGLYYPPKRKNRKITEFF